MIQLENISVKYGKTVALHPVSLDIKDSQFTVLLGSSGAGKSTFLRCLNLMNPLESGNIRVSGFEGSWEKRALQILRRETGMIFQQHQLIERQTALQNVLMGRLGYHSFFRTLFPLSKAEQELGLQCLKRVGLLDKALCRVDELSGGQQQRVGIARVLAQKPKTILADEPVASLDPATADKVLNLIHTICKEDGISAVVSLHQVDLAKKYGDRIIGLAAGRVVFDGQPDELSERQVEALYQNRLVDSEFARSGQLMNIPVPFVS
ncbi:phosphonate ABC transporter ATP-binding protein [Oxalobacter formigenes]|uniref:Phosphonate ABC transporter, ATP-binding protein n=1 Tax=Oxalobacter formigenes OXCC13 TaxID=556269 RepID=C3XC10_OXAFO|nr:phosphonate ABC transporter ATP-binding protein [Oxalobacter formigenes]ARQ45092.1 Phosphate-import ATP-binding protein PhnC [Oxalobacter formigenes]ARQ77405.1 phosphonate ABC transporter ATP-binding protein [Oxalobacter formigenes OXCC13]EEO30736.1 phosphonate ABC transporter, ATP-binding protein [Oxalobacter formigenes OXCC13]MCZ4063175.1 phosphonate ABC transporter ATP-binding protein [Oxalobacter formigenes]QDX34060.1 phosphonate ABC transporter ATP-binding protein [Oxalobacter formigen